MGDSTHIRLTPETTGLFSSEKPAEETASRVSELLEENTAKHHIYFNSRGFHNHILHHLLAIYSLGASTKEIEENYKDNLGYQVSLKPVHGKLPTDMTDKATFDKYLGKSEYYHDYLVFFQQQVEARGVETVVKEYLFQSDDFTNDMLARSWAAFYHPMINLGYGIEYKQPMVVAEGMAWIAVHNAELAPLFLGAERAAAQVTSSSDADRASQPASQVKPKTLLQLAHEARQDEKLRTSVQKPPMEGLENSVLSRAGQEMIQLAAQWTVKPDELEAKFAEMIAFASYMTASAQRPPHIVKMDFFYMHAVTTCPMLCALLDAEWLSIEQKCRALEWKGRLDLGLYVAQGSAELLPAEISSYQPKKPSESDWPALFRRARSPSIGDDGHVAKFVRALAFGEQRAQKYSDEEWCVIKGHEWKTVANMVMDSVEDQDTHWNRHTGFDQAWANVPLREKQQQL